MEDLRVKLARELRRDVPAGVWDRLVKSGYAEDAEKTGAGFADLVDEARGLLPVFDAGRGYAARKAAKTDLSAFFMDAEKLRRLTVARHVAATAHSRPGVVAFREEALGGSWPLPYKQALRHVDRDGGVLPDGPHAARLRGLCGELAVACRWDPRDASFFVLTLYTPPLDTFGVEIDPERGTVTMEVEPWLPADQVARMYRDAQRRMLGKEPRSVSADSLRLLEFAEEEKPGLSWREAMELWNERNPDRPYSDRGNFHRAVKKARSLVLEPAYAALEETDHAEGDRRERIEREIKANSRLLRSLR